MKKRGLAFLIVLCMLLMWVPAVSAAEGDVEIRFSVGDSTLTINGNPVTVETPYVVDPGVTLVPLRVITEAFGAKVDWIAETKSIPIAYEGVNILLQIDNPVAEVNGKAETLLTAPQLTANGFTMVPLRFISETFGAQVGYDDATRAITVLKTKNSGGQTVIGAADEAYIGDSYYGWSMENPKDMVMDERTFEGLYTSFTYDDENYFEISIDNEKDFDFDTYFNQSRNALNNYTLVKAEKQPPAGGVKSAHLQARSSTRFYNIHIFANDRYQLTLFGACSTENEEKRAEFVRLTDTIKMSFDAKDTYDLSNVKDGWRTYKNEEMKFSLSIPQDFYQSSSEEQSPNSVDFYSMDNNDTFSHISCAVYSKSSVSSVKEMAESDYAVHSKVRNHKIVQVTNPIEKTYGNRSVWEYTMTVTNSSNKDSITRDVFFEVGDYVYNVTVVMKSGIKNGPSMMDTVLESIQTEEIDSNKVGILLRNEIDLNSTAISKASNWSMTIPGYFDSGTVGANGGIYFDPVSGSLMNFSVDPANGATQNDVTRVLSDVQKDMVKSDEYTTATAAKEVSIGGKRYSTCITQGIDEDHTTYYLVEYATVQKNKVYYYIVDVPELSYSTYMLSTLEKIVGSLTVN